jgi:hypothetical protein
MKHWIAAGTTMLMLVLTAPAAGAPPLRDRFPVDAGPFPLPELTAACGFPVDVALTGTFSVLVVGNREIDTQPGTKLVYSSASGATIAVPFSGTLHASYPEGIVAGAPAIIALTGNPGPFNGIPGPGSGRLVFDAVIVETEDGFAFTRFTNLLTQSGNFSGQAARICAALA